MLDKILAGLQTGLILIKDSQAAPGRKLIHAFLASFCQRYEKVVLLATERPPDFYINFLPEGLQHRVLVVDNITEMLPVPGVERGTTAELISRFTRDITDEYLRPSRVGVVVDGLASLLYSYSPAIVRQTLSGLADDMGMAPGNRMWQVVALIHEDLHHSSDVQIIESRTRCVINLLPTRSDRHVYRCRIRYGVAFRKLQETVEDFNISEDFRVRDFLTRSDSGPVNREVRGQVAPVNPAANVPLNLNVPFNLNLLPAEREARNQVQNPNDNVPARNAGGGGQILYAPDEADDVDDEDPDEDLDF